MAKVTLVNVPSVTGNPAAVAQALNENFARLAAAIENTLSRDGTEPNQLEADLDLNGYALTNTVIGDEVVIEESGA
jgi:hypothetical protein